jgi:hypothetical protein
MCWELYTGRRAYAGLSREAVIDRVFRAGLRPRFPAAAPPPFASLCEACWQTDPAQRPSFAEINVRLEALAEELSGAAAGAVAAAASAPGSAAGTPSAAPSPGGRGPSADEWKRLPAAVARA